MLNVRTVGDYVSLLPDKLFKQLQPVPTPGTRIHPAIVPTVGASIFLVGVSLHFDLFSKAASLWSYYTTEGSGMENAVRDLSAANDKTDEVLAKIEKIRPVIKAVIENFDDGMERRETGMAAVEASLKEKEHEARKLGQKLDSFTMEDLDAGINRLAKRVEATLLKHEKGLTIFMDAIEELEAAKKNLDDVVDILEKTKHELKKVVEEIGVLQGLILAKKAEKERALNAPRANK